MAQTWAATPAGRATLRWARRGLSLLIVGVLLLQLSRVGWQDVWAGLPTSPLFYLLVVLSYAALPITESLIYRKVWRLAPLRSVWTLLKKRVYNMYVLEYSGEAYLYTWARKATGRSDGALLRDIRDVNILSNVASVGVTVCLVGGFLATGTLNLHDLFGASNPVYVAVGAVLAGLLAALGVAFRRHLFSMSAPVAAFVLALHLNQVLVINALRIAQWTVALPAVPLLTWAILLSTMLLLERVPLLPNKDLVLVAASVGLAASMEVAAASLAATLLVANVFGKSLHLLVLGAAYFFDRSDDEAVAPVAPSQRPAD